MQDDENTTEDNTSPSGDDIYLSLGLDPINRMSTTIYLVPPTGGGPAIPAFRTKIVFSDDTELNKIIPLDDLLMILTGLTDAVDTDAIAGITSSLAMLNADQDHALKSIQTIKDNIDKIENLIRASSINKPKIDDEKEK